MGVVVFKVNSGSSKQYQRKLVQYCCRCLEYTQPELVWSVTPELQYYFQTIHFRMSVDMADVKQMDGASGSGSGVAVKARALLSEMAGIRTLN